MFKGILDFLTSMLSDDSKVSSKRVVGFGTWLLFVAVVIVYLTNYLVIQSEILYAIVTIICGCFGLNAIIDAKAFGKNKVKDNFLKTETETKDNEVVKKTVTQSSSVSENAKEPISPIQTEVSNKVIIETKKLEIEDADILDGIKEDFKKPLDGTKTKTLLAAGTAYLGTTEVAGSGDNKVILDFAKKADISWYNDDATPWCAIFANAMCDISGLKETKSAMAKSFLTWGKAITIEEAFRDNTNVVGIFHRGNPNGSSGHVAILKQVSEDRKTAQMLGGNQSDKVCIQNFKLDDKFLGFRRGEYV